MLKKFLLPALAIAMCMTIGSHVLAQDTDGDGNTDGTFSLRNPGGNNDVIYSLDSTGAGGAIIGSSIFGNRFFMSIDDQSASVTGAGAFDVFQMQKGSPSGSLSLTPTGVGIGRGFSRNFTTGNAPIVPMAPLHIENNSNGTDNFPTTQIRVNDTNPTRKARNMFELQNNGGVRIRLKNTNPTNGESWLMATNEINHFSIFELGQGNAVTMRNNGFFELRAGGVQTMRVQPNGNLFTLGTVNGSSDRNLKQDIEAVDSVQVLDKVVGLPLSEWSYIHDPKIRHMGPMAQDFRAAFGLGENDTSIAMIDESGVALVAIQGLNKKLNLKDKKIAELESELKKQKEIQEKQRVESDDLAARLEQLEAAVSSLSTK